MEVDKHAASLKAGQAVVRAVNKGVERYDRSVDKLDGAISSYHIRQMRHCLDYLVDLMVLRTHRRNNPSNAIPCVTVPTELSSEHRAARSMFILCMKFERC